MAVLVFLLAAAFPFPSGASENFDESDGLTRIERALWDKDGKENKAIREWAKNAPSEKLRERSLGALALLGDPAAGSVVLDRLERDESPLVRRAAAEAMGLLHLIPSKTFLFGVMQKEKDAMVRAEIARGIGRALNHDGVPALFYALASDTSADVRALCVEAIGKIKPPDGPGMLTMTLADDPSLIVRIYAVRAIGATGQKDAFAVVRDAFQTARDPELRVEAFRQLLKLGTPDEWEEKGFRDSDDQIRFTAFSNWLSRQLVADRPPRKSPIIVKLADALSDKHPGIRDLAREALIARGYSVIEVRDRLIIEE